MSKGFDLGDNWQQNTDKNSDGAESHLALLQDSGMAHIERVADKGKQATTQKVDDRTPSEKQFEAAVKEFQGASGDKGAALLKLGPKFDTAIKTADDDFVKTMTAAKPEAEKLAPLYEAATAKVEEQQAKLQGTFSKVPKGEQEKVSSLVEAYTKLGQGDQGVKTAIESNLAKYPGLIQGVKDLDAASNAPAIKQMDALEQKVKRAMEDRIMTRAGYAEILSNNGFDAKAEDLLRDAAKIMGVEVPEKQKPKGLLEASYRKA
jgi:hypothetical protein